MCQSNSAELGRSDGSQCVSAEAGVSKNTWTAENVWHVPPVAINTLKIFMAFTYAVLLETTTQLEPRGDYPNELCPVETPLQP